MISRDSIDDPGGSSPRIHAARRPERDLQRVRRHKAQLKSFLLIAKQRVGLRGHVHLLLAGDGRIRRLNLRFRGKDSSTDVLSFPAEPDAEFSGDGVPVTAGDLAISVPAALRQAGEHGHDLLTELKILSLHGLLHLAGMDHESDAGEMRAREQHLRAELGLPSGLIERSEHTGNGRSRGPRA